MRPSALGLIYLVAGGIIAANRHYYESFETTEAVGSAVLATALWPLLLLGINLHIH